MLARFGMTAAITGTSEDAVVTAEVEAGDFPPETIVSALVEADVRVRGFAVVRETLEDRFVALTGEGFDVIQ